MPFLILLALAASDAAASEANPPGAAPTVAESVRKLARSHFAMGVVVGGVVSASTLGGIGGATIELGVTLIDRVTLGVRAHLLAFVVSAPMALVFVDVALSERWSVGLGAGVAWLVGFAQDLPALFTLQVPLRAQFSIVPRGVGEVSRRGPRLFLEVGPGAVLGGSRGFQPPSVSPMADPRWAAMATLGALFAW